MRGAPAPLRSTLKLSVWAAKRTVFPALSIVARARRRVDNAAPEATFVHDSRVIRFQDGDIYASVGGEWVPPTKVLHIEGLRNRGIRTMLCCHDLIPLLLPHLCMADATTRFRDHLADLAAAADTVLCISRNTRDDFEAFLAGLALRRPRLVTLYLGADAQHAQSDPGDLDFLTHHRFVLYVSTIERRKNHEVLYKAYVTIRERLGRIPPKCVLVGAPGWGTDDVLSDIETDPRVKGDFFVLHRIGDGQLRWLYEHCLFTVYPSLYEGWGLPIAESLRDGKFVLASDRSSMPEAGAGFAELLDPWDVRAWAERIQFYAENHCALEEKENTIARSYVSPTWINTARCVQSEIDGLLAGAGAQSPTDHECGTTTSALSADGREPECSTSRPLTSNTADSPSWK